MHDYFVLVQPCQLGLILTQYCSGSDDKIRKAVKLNRGDDDAAKQLVDSHDVELWQRDKRSHPNLA